MNSGLPTVGIFIKWSTLPLVVRVTERSLTICFVLYLRSLSTYDIVITTYSLLAKEIPTKKQEGEAPGMNLNEEVRLGAESHTPSPNLVTTPGMAMVPLNVLSSSPVKVKHSLLCLFSFVLDSLSATELQVWHSISCFWGLITTLLFCW